MLACYTKITVGTCEYKSGHRGSLPPIATVTGPPWDLVTTLCCAEATLRLDGEDSCSYEAIAEAIEEVPGVIAHGLVLKDNVIAVVHTPEGAQILRKVPHWSPQPY